MQQKGPLYLCSSRRFNEIKILSKNENLLQVLKIKEEEVEVKLSPPLLRLLEH